MSFTIPHLLLKGVFIVLGALITCDIASAQSTGSPKGQQGAVTTKQAIQSAQMQLLALGYELGSADGAMGPKTTTSLKQFQSDHYLPVTGVFDRKTLDALKTMPPAASPGSKADDTKVPQEPQPGGAPSVASSGEWPGTPEDCNVPVGELQRQGKWPLNHPCSSSAVLVDEAGHEIEGSFYKAVAWKTDAQRRLVITKWDNTASFCLVSNPRFNIPGSIIKTHLRLLTTKRTGTLSGDVLAPLEVEGSVTVKSNTIHLVTADGDYEVVNDSVGKRLSEEMNGKAVIAQAQITGETTTNMTLGGFNFATATGSISSVAFVSRITVASFREAPLKNSVK